MFQNLFDDIPTYLLAISTFLIFLLFFHIGYLIGKIRRQKEGSKGSEVISPATASILGLFAFLIAFSFNIAAQKLDTRKQNVLLEANTIRTVYLRADLLQDPYKTNIKVLLREYTDIRLKIVSSKGSVWKEFLSKSDLLQNHIWNEFLKISEEENTATVALLGTSMNKLFDMHHNRVAASIYNRISANIWLMLFSIGMLGMLMTGVQAGLNGRRRYIAIIPLILAFTVIFSIIEDLDNPQRGIFKVGQQPLIDVQNSIKK